jgi:mRNA (guanine-N7-)-methyltransferase
MNSADSDDRMSQRPEDWDKHQSSSFIRLHDFTKWVKSSLIDRYCPYPNASVFDCACGKGSDIRRLKLKHPSFYVFGDISEASVKRAFERYRTIERKSTALFLVGNIFQCSISEFIPPQHTFHLSSCQMALHYAFESEDLARNAIHNLCEPLLPGGFVLLTIPNACRIVRQLRNAAPSEVIGNNVYEITRYFPLDNIPAFGAGYVFNMRGAVDHCTEYLVHPTILIALFQEFDCCLIETMDFHKFYHDALTNFPPYKFLFNDFLFKSKIDVDHAEMTQEEWECIALHSYFVFKKQKTDKKKKEKKTIPTLAMDMTDPGKKDKQPLWCDMTNVDTGAVFRYEIDS